MLAAEEARFAQTLKNGQALLDDVLARSGGEVSAADVFKLHDTYGFPFELTQSRSPRSTARRSTRPASPG